MSPSPRARPRSERAALLAILAAVGALRRELREPRGGRDDQTMTGAVDAIEHEARTLMIQVQRGVHSNPPLVIYGNPPFRVRRPYPFHRARGVEPVAVISADVHQVKYEHADDNRDYVHDFEGGVEMAAALRGSQAVLLFAHRDGLPLWEDF